MAKEEEWRLAPQVDTGENLIDVAVAQRAGLEDLLDETDC